MEGYKIGQRIQKYRKTAGLTQEQLAESVDLSVNFISNIERGAKLPCLETFVRIANAVDAPPDLLLIDVIEDPHKDRLEDYFNRIEKLPQEDRKRILAVIDTLLSVW